MNLRSLPHLVNFAGASTWERTLACLAIVWVVIVVLGARFVIILYRRGFLVAVTSDGLFVRLPASKEAMIPWTQIASAEIKEKPAGKPQVARVVMKGEQKNLDAGGVNNVFPKRVDVERFVEQVNTRAVAARGEEVS